MRLKQIKLSGFKSFVDPTSIQIPSQLVGVVGPNGCGKSNVIDAVRWVLGESKASELRGESMQDVIFNGSSERKPSARASVELVFDNSLGRIGGHWAQYAEISVRRILSRDNQSVYQINNQSVRRRDVYDMFLGTGLGPRAYAIIGQGTISRLIEAKPEELRVYLEEAAGVSKYKERRRETESRLASTRENLSRVDDIALELDGQITRLTRQAEVAGRFRQWDAERTRVQQMQWVMRRDDALAALERSERSAGEAATALEAKTTELRRTEREIESLRQQVEAAGDDVHKAQANYYEANAEVARVESEIRRVTEARDAAGSRAERLGVELASLAERDAAIDQRLIADRHDAERFTDEIDQGEQQVNAARERLEQSQHGWRAQGESLEQARMRAAEHRHAGERLALELRTVESSLRSVEERLARDASSLRSLEVVDPGALAASRARVDELTEREQRVQAQLDEAQQAWRQTDTQRAPAQLALREAQSACAQVEAREHALRELQDRLDRQNSLQPWLQAHGLDSVSPLWERLRVDEGWELAVEAVLRERVAARQIEAIDSAVALAADVPPAKVALFGRAGADIAAAPGADDPGLRPLLSRVRSGEAAVMHIMAEWLAGVYVAETVEQAVAGRGRLPAGAIFVVPQGHRVGRLDIALFAADSEREGVLQRQHELENLERDVRAKRLLLDDAKGHADRIEAAAVRFGGALEKQRAEHGQLGRALGEARMQAQALSQRSERTEAERGRLEHSVGDLEQEVGRLRQRRDALIEQRSLNEADAAPLAQALDRSRAAREQAETDVAGAREALREAEHALQAARYQTESVRTRIAQLERERGQIGQRRVEAQTEQAGLVERLAGLDLEPLQQSLQSGLQRRSETEQALAHARQRQSDLAATLRETDGQRAQIEAEREPLMQRCTEMQVKAQSARLSIEQYQEQLLAAGVDEAAEKAVRDSFDERPALSWLQSEISRLGKAIDALGPVNLAALEELEQATERRGFLQAQQTDLNEAIATLEDAILHIDRETRSLLQDTFDTVNGHFGTLFPEVFGGGDAKLVLTGEEILDSGVQVMAHPPGKRNASIHLLSGGEKALTAIALVFALFQLNPAPFCLLDEVDAPLDDANTERYRAMVQRMSDQTQFLFITHNKIAMEMAQQLVGVTMQERGVSRIVAVDLDSAAEMAEAA
ncbi:MAG: chromosome segregation protein SMC [Burkholderiaceae bacterium]